jgi:[ribosomal protein S5]-alanine N-acetyltransferase
MPLPLLASRRLDLPPLTIAALEALIAGDRPALETVTGARFPEPLAAPPLMDDALPHFRDVLLASPDDGSWGPYLLVLREFGEAVGSAGFTGPPDDTGAVTLGYSVYPVFQRQGIASEAAEALASWALTQPGVRRVRATIPPEHVASQRVAARAGFLRTGRVEDDPDEGPVEVWERLRG